MLAPKKPCRIIKLRRGGRAERSRLIIYSPHPPGKEWCGSALGSEIFVLPRRGAKVILAVLSSFATTAGRKGHAERVSATLLAGHKQKTLHTSLYGANGKHFHIFPLIVLHPQMTVAKFFTLRPAYSSSGRRAHFGGIAFRRRVPTLNPRTYLCRASISTSIVP